MRTRVRYGTLLGVILGAIALYTGFWFYAIGKAEDAFYAFVRAEQGRGNAVEYASVSWGGYPVRLSATLTGLRYSAAGLEIEAGQAMIEVLPWAPTNALVRAEGNLRVAYREPDRAERIEMKPSLILASVKVDWAGALQQASVELRDPDAKGAGRDGKPFSFRAKRLQADARTAGATTGALDSYDLGFSADRLDLLDGGPALLGSRIASIRVAARFTKLPPFSSGYRPDGRRDLVRRLQSDGVEAEIAPLDFDWGAVAARGTGRLALDPKARLAGQLDFNVKGLADLVKALSALGLLEGKVEALEDLPQTPDGMMIALALKDGLVTFGPYKVGTLSPLD